MKPTKYLSVLAIAALFASCAKQGPTGLTGPPGQDGVANINTYQYTVTTGGWTYVPSNTWIATFSEPDITSADGDAVEAYWSNASSGWLGLPTTNLDAQGDELNYGYNTGTVTFDYYGNSNAPTYYQNTLTIYFKVTVIPPSIQVKYPNVNWKNATQVAAMVPEVQAALAKTK